MSAPKSASSLTSLRKDNEVKLEEIKLKSVTREKELIRKLWTAISRQRVNEDKCMNSTKSSCDSNRRKTERRLQERTADA